LFFSLSCLQCLWFSFFFFLKWFLTLFFKLLVLEIFYQREPPKYQQISMGCKVWGNAHRGQPSALPE
jgi:hypothetical protein